jgi:hypothetical protein
MFRGNIVMKGYLKNPGKRPTETFAGGWFHSGDLGVMHPDGYIQLKDRSKDIIISGGENISSIEVEDALLQTSGDHGRRRRRQTDDKWGETPCAPLSNSGPENRSPRKKSSSIAASIWPDTNVPVRSSFAKCPKHRPARSRNSCSETRQNHSTPHNLVGGEAHAEDLLGSGALLAASRHAAGLVQRGTDRELPVTMDPFQAIADPNRRHLLEELRRQPRTVNQLAKGLPISRPAVSQHLKALLDCGLVTVQNQGTSRVYAVRTDGFMHLNLWVDQFWS